MKWPERMPEGGRLPQSDDAWGTGYMCVVDPRRSCSQTLHISLFFDGTNNNDAEDNFWRDSKKNSHTNVARLFNSALHIPNRRIHKSYIPGVGTPFPQIGELIYTQKGKALAKGFNQRCIWAYTRVLNTVYNAIASDKKRSLMRDDPDAKTLCNACANGDMAPFEPYLNRLSVAHKQAVDESAWPRTVKQIWINVIGFSRGAASARAFVYKLINEWAPGGKLGSGVGKYALPYTVNFMGLFDGHADFANNGALAIPPQVRYCVHAFSIHEQRMSFPLDSIRKDHNYPNENRYEIAYPGVHSDIGGGYGPGEQGKGCDNNGKADDARKLSQIPLHDMYIAALKFGVQLMHGDEIRQTPRVTGDFALNPDTVAAFNAWLGTTSSPTTLEGAMQFGMGQMLSWRTLRAQLNQPSYLTHQKFFQRAHEDALTPKQVADNLDKAKKTDPQLKALNQRLAQAVTGQLQATGSPAFPGNMSAVMAADRDIQDARDAIRTRIEELCGQVAHPNAPTGPLPNVSRPGEGPDDIVTNDKTDLRQGAEEMRLLLGYLYPEQREALGVQVQMLPMPPVASPMALPKIRHLFGVRHEHPGSDSPKVSLVDIDLIKIHSARSILAQIYSVDDDVVAKPVENALPFLKQHTSHQAVSKLSKAAITLFDDYIHDSRCWFRVPYFHEYAPGGYFWPRVVYVGSSKRAAWLGFDPMEVALDAINAGESALA